jgi:arylsulfatase A-like enzyme
MNVLVVAAHGLNCHGLGPYGNPWVATPAADALAAEAVVFDRHFADDPSPTGARRACPPALIAALRAAGVTTTLINDRKDRSPDDRGWDRTLATDPDHHSTPGAALLAAVRSALDQVARNSPWLVWIETERLLPPWDLELETYHHYASTSGGFAAADESDDDEPAEVEPTNEPTPGPFDVNDDREWHRLHNSFGAAVTAFDAELGELAREFRVRGVDESAAWIVTSGHGYPLGEHGIVGPSGSRMHEEFVHLPLIIRLPAQQQRMRRVPAFTQAADLAPTIADLFGVAVPAGVPGRSLLPLTVGAVADWRPAARSATGAERAVRTPEWAFLAAVPGSDRPARLYRKPDDIWEVNDLAPRHPDECDRLAALLDAPSDKEPYA